MFFLDVLSLYKQHPEFSNKTKNIEDIKEFVIKDTGEFRTKCFYNIHIDGTESDWSYKTAIKAKNKTKFQCFVDASRNLLESRIYHFRDSEFSSKCKKFIIFKGYTLTSFPTNWVSVPLRLQYRSELSKSISIEFVKWYKVNNKL